MKWRRAWPWLGGGILIGVIGALLVFTRQPAPPAPDPDARPNAQGADQRREPEALADLAPPTKAEIDAARAAGAIPFVIHTSRGEIRGELRGDLMPLTVANFVKLAQRGFYDGLTFHRVEDWVTQGGDPKGTGAGGPGYAIPLETSADLKNVRGAVAMARTRVPDSAGSQFYILKADAPHLDGEYAVFGRVTEGLDVVDRIARGDTMQSVRVGDAAGGGGAR